MRALDPARVVCLSATPTGRSVAERLPYRHVHGDIAGTLAHEWPDADGFVVVLAVGATVRLVAPLLADKASDPCVVCVDDAGDFAVVVAGGHAGGGNALAADVAALLGATPVVTTATDRLGLPALDQLPGLRAEGAVAAVTSRLLGGDAVTLENDLGWPLPDALIWRSAPGAGARVVVTDRTERSDPAEPIVPSEPGDPVVWLRPASLVVGVGTSSDATERDTLEALEAALDEARLAAASVGLVATIDRRAGHRGVRAIAHALGARIAGYPPEVLDTVRVPSPSEVVRAAVGTGSVAEAAALLGAGRGASLVAGKHRTARVTIAVARRAEPAGSVHVVGLGPGHPAHRTPAAARAVRSADVVVGYSSYVDQCRDLLVPAQRVLEYPLGAEVERARAALDEAAKGQRVALVCSGDAGVYAMASPLLELAESAAVDVEVVPGVTAALAAAALLGAPLGHDHASVSLSDLHTAWETIEGRLRAVAAADFVVTLYNPRSARRTWQLDVAREIFLEHRPSETPVGIVTDAGRSGEHVVRTTLGTMPVEEVTMTSCVVVGARSTRMVGDRMMTPRGYDT